MAFFKKTNTYIVMCGQQNRVNNLMPLINSSHSLKGPITQS